MCRSLVGSASTGNCFKTGDATECYRDCCLLISYVGDTHRAPLSLQRNPRGWDRVGHVPVAASRHADRLANRRPGTRDAADSSDLHRNAQRDCRTVCCAILLSGYERFYGADCLLIADGADEPSFPSRIYRMAKTAPHERYMNTKRSPHQFEQVEIRGDKRISGHCY